MKKVVILKSGARNHGGLEKQTQRIFNAFTEKGAQVTLLTTGEAPSSHAKTFSVPRWPSFLRLEKFDQEVQKWLLKNPAEIVLGMDRNRFQTHLRAGNGVHRAYLESRILSEGKLKHWISTFNPLHRKILELEKEGFENPKLKKIFANSEMIRKDILEKYNVDPQKIEVIHNGVEWSEMQSDFLSWKEKKKEICDRYQLDPDGYHFLFIGNGYLRKGLDRLMEALSKLSRKDIHLTVIGKDKRMDFYQKKAKKLGLSTRFLGVVKNVLPFYQMSDALVIPSFYDPFANVTVEALSMGLFVLSSKRNGGFEILNSQNGAVIEDLWNEEEIIDRLQLALSKKKTEESSLLIRQSVEYLDFSKQLKRFVDACE